MRLSLACALTVSSAVAVTFCGLVRPASAQDLVARTEHQSPEQERKSFRLPPGFEIQLVAAEPDIDKPMNIAFDAKGRLWVTSTVEYPYPAKEGETPRDKVIVLSDFAQDGRARKVETFAEGLNIPIGLLPVENGALVFAINHVRRMLDTDGDGRADKNELLLGTYGFRDTHGMTNHFTVGFDGWVYANHGFNNESDIKASDGSSLKLTSGNNYRFKLDGSRVEPFAWGQVNPFGLTFDPLGNLYSADCHTRPQYLLLRGAVYPSFGKPDDGLGFGPEMCFHDHGSTGIAGTLYYAADHFPEKYRGMLFNGNPVTNRINHDVLKWNGSSPLAVDQGDFLASDDAWFRPVDLVLGPDGAIYIADFYNRIIGHYEVDLAHPGRDRTSGRIWRIVYRGEDGKGAVPAVPDLSKATPAELVERLGDGNLAVRMMAQRQLVERADRVKSIRVLVGRDVARARNVPQAVHVLWAQHQLDILKDEALTAAMYHAEREVRVHAIRIVSEKLKVSPTLREAVRQLIQDPDAHVRRAAADALGRHPRVENIRPLLAARKAAQPEDGHLVHTIRMALRDQLESTPVVHGIAALKLNEDEERGLADVIAGVKNPDVGGLVMAYLTRGITDPGRTVQLLLQAAKRLPPGDVDTLTDTVLQRFPGDLDLQRQLFVSLLEGLAQRGAEPGEATRRWGTELAEKLAASEPFDPGAWTFYPLDGAAAAAAAENLFSVEQRPLNDPAGVALWSSLPRGEGVTGVLRSREFEIPAKLSFLIAGHYGSPDQNEELKNLVRLRLADADGGGGKTVAEARVPRNDTPQRVDWDLAAVAGKKGYIEAVDADARGAYAWVAFGRFEPAVAPTPPPTAAQDRIVAAAVIARALKLENLRERMEQLVGSDDVDPQARAGAARALGAIGTGASVKVLARAASDPNVPPAVRQAVSQSLAEQNTAEARESLLAAIAAAPEPLQRALSVSLAGNAEGAEALLGAVRAGKASPRLLQDPQVAERLKAANLPDLDTRLAELTKGLVPADEAVNRLIEQRRAGYDPADASAERGLAVFTKNCSACHKVGEVGVVIGPQLDGLGQRGLDRIVEDVVDPNRNVDGAFRTTILRLKGGETVSGLLRREEGASIVLADSTGKESSVPAASVQRRAESPLSLMPSNFGEILTPGEFNDLMKFLLSK
jgi:putative heme-binding domain-containing protein